MKSINCYTKRSWIWKKIKLIKTNLLVFAKWAKKGIVIPKEIRTMFDINPGDSVIVLCDKEKGIALLKAEVIDSLTDKVLKQ